METEFEGMKGRIITKIVGGIGDEKMRFMADDGGEFVLYYDHD